MAPQSFELSTAAVISVPIFFAVAIILSCGELCHRRARYHRVSDVEREPLLPPCQHRRAGHRRRQTLAAPGRAVGATHPAQAVARNYGTAPAGNNAFGSSNNGYIRFSGGSLAAVYGDVDWHQPFDNLAPPLTAFSAIPAPLRQDRRRTRSTPPEEPRQKTPRTASSAGTQKTWKTMLIHKQTGQAASVKTVKSTRTGELYIVKAMPMRRSAQTGQFVLPKEVRMLHECIGKHPSILNLRGFHARIKPEHGTCHIAYDLCSGGDLYDFIERAFQRMRYQGEYVHPIFILHVLDGMASALGFLHLGLRTGNETGADSIGHIPRHQPVVHGDIKPDNVFLRWTANSEQYGLPEIILGDFGFAEFESESRGVYGTRGFYPPEAAAVLKMSGGDAQRAAAFEKKVLTTASDMYSFGVTLFQLIFLAFGMGDQYSHAPPADQIDVWFERVPAAAAQLPACVRSILKRCLAHAPNNRLSTEEIVAHRSIFKSCIASLHERGYCMPQCAFPKLPPMPSSEQGPAPSSAYSHDTVFDADDMMADISGFTANSQLCWDYNCPNHTTPGSKRHLKSGCEAGQQLVLPDLAAAPHVSNAGSDSSSDDASVGAEAYAEPYANAILLNGYNDATEA